VAGSEPGQQPSPEGPRLVVVVGLLASGKSTVSRELAHRLGAEHLHADALREAAQQRGEPAYVPGYSAELYDELLARAAAALDAGRSVVLDGTFRTQALRRRARDIASGRGARFLCVECVCDPAVCRVRLRERTDPEGWLEMFEHFLTLWEPVEELPPAEHQRVDTARRPEAVAVDLAALVARL